MTHELKTEIINDIEYHFRKVDNQLYGSLDGKRWNNLGNISKKEVIKKIKDKSNKVGHNLEEIHKPLENMTFRIVDTRNGFNFVSNGKEDWVLGLNNKERNKALKLKLKESMKVVGDGSENFKITKLSNM